MPDTQTEVPTDMLADPKTLTILTTEHYNLQSARGLVVSESNGRTSSFLSAVSSGLVALAFIGQISKLGEVFFLFSLALFPPLLFMGLVTFIRVLQTSIEDFLYTRGINRIRHYYTEIAPQIEPYLVLSTHDDHTGMFENMGMATPHFQLWMTTAGLIGVINGVLAGAFAAIVTYYLLPVNAWGCAAIGASLFGVTQFAQQRHQLQTWRSATRNAVVRFPSSGNG